MANSLFIQQLKEHGFTDNQISQIQNVTSPLELPTRHILVQQGEQAKYAYFVIEGLCHACYLTDEGKQFSKEFYWEQDWMIGFEGLINNQPSPFLLETLTPVSLLCLPIEELQRWRKESNPLYVKLLETQLVYKEAKERFMLLYTPEERYQLFCSSFPDLELSDYQIAAYLGVA